MRTATVSIGIHAPKMNVVRQRAHVPCSQHAVGSPAFFVRNKRHTLKRLCAPREADGGQLWTHQSQGPVAVMPVRFEVSSIFLRMSLPSVLQWYTHWQMGSANCRARNVSYSVCIGSGGVVSVQNMPPTLLITKPMGWPSCIFSTVRWKGEVGCCGFGSGLERGATCACAESKFGLRVWRTTALDECNGYSHSF